MSLKIIKILIVVSELQRGTQLDPDKSKILCQVHAKHKQESHKPQRTPEQHRICVSYHEDFFHLMKTIFILNDKLDNFND